MRYCLCNSESNNRERNIQLLVRADDAGSSWSSNVGCLRACTQGIARSVEVMMPCSWTSHAATLFNQHPEIDVGIHLTLTSEWDAVKWRPLTPAASLTDEHGNFLPLVLPREGDSRPCLAHAAWSIDEIVNEFRAQSAIACAMFQNVSHVSAHMVRHFKELDPAVGDVVSELCDDFGLADDAFGHGLHRVEGYPTIPRDTVSRVSSFRQTLTELNPGTHIFIDHPAAASPELEETGHKGYDDVSIDRTTCLETLTSRELRQHIDELGIELISYRDL